MKKLLLSIAAFGCLQISAQTTSCFTTSPTYTTNNGATAILTADFNNDGKPDVACVNSVPGTMDIRLNSGGGYFFAGITYSLAGQSWGLASADFNTDGNMDLAAVISSGTISVFFGNGTGGFATAVNYSAPFSETIIARDMNGDGKADLVVNNHYYSNIGLLLNSGTGTFGPKVSFNTSVSSSGQGPAYMVVDDFNNDGKADVATSNDVSNDVSVLLGTGSGSFLPVTNYTIGSTPLSITSGDVNGDGKKDIITSNSTAQNISVLLGSVSGTFSAANNYTVNTTGTLRDVKCVDINADGNLDIVTCNSIDLHILLGNGSGTFPSTVTFTNSPLHVNCGTLTFGDYNNDTKLDIASAGGLGGGFGSGFLIHSSCVAITNINKIEENKSIGVFPNPVNELLYIDAPFLSATITIKLIDVSGRIILSENASESKKVLNLQSFEKGLYLLVMQDDTRTYVKQIIKE